MANYATLKGLIDQYITTNGQGAITGAVLNDVLKNIVNSIGADYLFGGVVIPSSNVGTPDQNVFFIATQGGSYQHFNETIIPDGITIFKWSGSWSYQILFAGDGGVFDISAYHNNTKYADLTAALGTNGANVPEYLQRGGMSVKFVRSSNNRYKQARCLAQNFTTNVALWQDVDDKPTGDSRNLVESGGVFKDISQLDQEIYGFDKNEYSGWADSNNKIISSQLGHYRVIQVNGGETIFLGGYAYIMILSDFSYNPTLPYNPTFATGESGRHDGDNMTYILPDDAKYLVINSVNNSGKDVFPTSLIVNGVDYTKTLRDWKVEIKKIKETFSTFIPLFEQGGINDTGQYVDRNDRIRTIDFIPIDKFISIYNNNANYKVMAKFYDTEKNYVLPLSSAFVNKIEIEEIPSNVAYLKFIVIKRNNEIITPSDEHGFEIMYNINTHKAILAEENKEKNKGKIDLIPFCKTSNNYINDAGQKIYSASWLLYEIKTDRIKSVYCTLFNSLSVVTYPWLAVAFYDKDNNYISGKNFSEIPSGVETFIANFPINAKTIAFANRIANGTAILKSSSLEDSLNVLGDAINDNANEINQVNDSLNGKINESLNVNYDSVGNAEFWLDKITVAYSDMTWVGMKLIGFYGSSDDLETEAGTIYINDYQNGIGENRISVYTLKHFWGHCNTVDYNPNTDCLILGNGSGEYSLAGKIFIIPNFSRIVNVSESNDTPMSLADVNALIIDCTSYNLGGKFNLIWGDDNNKNYNIAYLITANINGSTSANGGDLETIRKIVLRKGENVGEYGSIISNSTPFNGTFDIVETYHQITYGYRNCDQGTCYYNGEIYAAIGHDGLWYWRMRMANEKIYKKDYKQIAYYNTNRNASGICVKDGYLFIGRDELGVMAIGL